LAPSLEKKQGQVDAGERATRTAVLTLVAVLTSCAGVDAVPVSPSSQADGIRRPTIKPLLVVGSQIGVIMVPNPNREYALRFWSFLAKNDLEAQFQNGMLNSLTDNQDSTPVPDAFLAALGQAAQAAKTSLLGAFAGQATGGSNILQIYDIVFDDSGDFIGLRPLIKPADLLPVPSAISIIIPQQPPGTNPTPTPVFTPTPAPTPIPGGTPAPAPIPKSKAKIQVNPPVH
jgi:hypothetical protein